ncbi:aminotransferase [Synechococcus sp. CC9902]|uniref:aminotransferase class III-fold pyridoxal phosphate-dependent enzyme n=1 Tax=Synechococcus sp. (strain CC9902) TaxID=316279 RepID=UPI00005D3CF5|nr:aminotransferase class III-fold pyridoxal phosphate-dependent enzyme [Synechococcus sp. CC9902]ABB25067.1 aminotransferase [Synechococcus sp. CC9902]
MSSASYKLTVCAIVQARSKSTRFPNKVLKNIGNGNNVIEFLVHRLKLAQLVDEIIIAIPDSEEETFLTQIQSIMGISIVLGSEDDVLERYYQCLDATNADIIVRITADCPLIDPEILDNCINQHITTHSEFTCNTHPPTYPDGMDVEVFNRSLLSDAYKNAEGRHEREHVTPWMKANAKILNVTHSTDLSDFRLTIDEKEDLLLINKLLEHLQYNIHADLISIIDIFDKYPELKSINSMHSRNEGSILPKSLKLWRRALKVIGKGNSLLSKNPDMFLPQGWPTYFSKTEGKYVWGIDNHKYKDMALMGVGTNLLGYSDPYVDESVYEIISEGNMSSLNCPEEVYLAEKMVNLHSWSDKVKFARSGAEANAIAVRLARACTGKEKILFCGYHGWHDWYLATNLTSTDNLAGHLLPGLNPTGVPKSLLGSIDSFQYNDIEEFRKLVSLNSYAAVIMEVERNFKPTNNFLETIAFECKKFGIILIFDECSSGFRETFGGLHKKYQVEPDMAMFGKALGNGYAITCVIGRDYVMEYCQESFISSTFWTERIGFTAALACLERMEMLRSWEVVTQLGEYFRSRLNDISTNSNLHITSSGISALSSYSIISDDWLKYKTYITQEFLKQDILATNSIYFCTKHSMSDIDQYIEILDNLFSVISECEYDQRDISCLLEFPICSAGFQRTN